MHWPQFTIGMVVLVYWGRVLRMAVKARRRTGRAGNIVPGERLGRWLRPAWMAAVLIWIANPLVVGFPRQPPSAFRPIAWPPQMLAWLAAAIAAAAALLTTICWRRMGKSWRMGIMPGERTTLIVIGPYRSIRHPIYSLSIIMMLATAVAVPSPLMLIAAVAHCTLLLWEAAREERHLLAVHGDVYADYRSSTGRFVPRFANAHA